MFFLKRFWLKITYRLDPPSYHNGPLIGYGDPSHSKFNKSPYIEPSFDKAPYPYPTTPPIFKKNKSASYRRKRSQTDPIIFFDDVDKLKYKIAKFLDGRKKTTIQDILKFLCSVIKMRDLRIEAESRQDIKNIVSDLLEVLKLENKVYFDEHHKSWYLQTANIKTISEKESNYLENVHKLGQGWKNIDHPDDAIQWIYSNFTPDQFESFCGALLEHSKVIEPHVSIKKEKSGADGGVDGYGKFKINNEIVDIIFQAKRYKPSNYVTVNEIRDFLGAYDFEDIQYGFFITTGLFSDSAIKNCKILNNKPNVTKKIQLIDKNKIIEIMLSKGKNPLGFGLFKTAEYDRYFINENILKNAVIASN